MTVAEHLTFFSLLKGMPKKRRAQRVETMIHEVRHPLTLWITFSGVPFLTENTPALNSHGSFKG